MCGKKKTLLWDHLIRLHFQQNTDAFETLQWRPNYMPALPLCLNIENTMPKWYFSAFAVCTHISSYYSMWRNISLFKRCLLWDSNLYSFLFFYHPASCSPWEGWVAWGFDCSLSLWSLFLGSHSWHISLWVAEIMLGNDKWFLVYLLVKPWQITPSFLNWWNTAGRFLSMPDFPDWFMLVSAAL